ncbi:hypothetical protein PENSPDRAFT_757333 [Peniophora sp. CONT]|nr:hypothetical protein PENSPDRAFT_757333 [Peniophora sp. CONT]
MELHFTRPDLLNAVLRDAHGTPVYRIKTDSALRVSERTTTLSRIIGAPTLELPELVSADYKSDSSSDLSVLDGLQEQLVGQEVQVDDHMPSSKAYAKRRTFTATNGQEYTWVYEWDSSTLEKGPPGTTPRLSVVEYNRRKHGLLPGKDSSYPWLRIAEESVPILDEIILTFIWVERRRHGKEYIGFDGGVNTFPTSIDNW